MGGIGRDLKGKAEALGMRVQYHNRKELDGDLAGGARYVGFDELLRTSDVISLNLPLNVSLLPPSAPFCALTLLLSLIVRGPPELPPYFALHQHYSISLPSFRDTFPTPA